jgi:putative transposase
VRYAFIKDHAGDFTIRSLCRLFNLHPSGYYAWLRARKSARQHKDDTLSGMIKQAWLESGCVYGYRKIHRDLHDLGERCGINRVHKLMRNDGIKAQVGYRRPRQRSGEVHVVTPNTLAREFNPSKPNHSWVTDITYIRTHEGWLYLGVVIDLYSRKIIGWSMDSRMVKELVLDALLMAVWRRKPESRVIVHSDQGSQYTSYEWQEFLEEHGLAGSMSRRGNCHDNAVAESFFQLLKRERIKKRVYLTRETAKRDIFNYIEMFYNPVRRHTANNLLSPQEFERRYKNEAEKCLLN